MSLNVVTSQLYTRNAKRKENKIIAVSFRSKCPRFEEEDDDGVRARAPAKWFSLRQHQGQNDYKHQSSNKSEIVIPVISGQQEAPGVAIPTFASLPHRLDANHRAGERERGHDDRGQVMKRRLSIGIIPRQFPATIVLVRFEERRPFLASSMLRHATTTHDDDDGRKNTLFSLLLFVLFAY